MDNLQLEFNSQKGQAVLFHSIWSGSGAHPPPDSGDKTVGT